MLAARRTGGTLIDYNIRLVSPLPTGVRPTDGRRACETVKRKRRPVGVCRRDANSTSRQTGRGRRARALPPRPVTFNSLIGLALPAASMGTSSLRTCPVPGSSRINRTALSPAAAAAATAVALNGHGGSWAEPASVAGAVFAFTRRRASSVVAVLVYYRRRRPIHSSPETWMSERLKLFIPESKLIVNTQTNYAVFNI